MYLSKETILKAYQVLSTLTITPETQGQTQITSSIRYFLALDAFTKKYERDCDLNEKEDRDKYTEEVGHIVSVDDKFYTANFYTTLYSQPDYNIGSNFFSAGVVKYSMENKSEAYTFPKKGKNVLFDVKAGVLKINKAYYGNILNILVSKEHILALDIWLCRNINLNVSDRIDLCDGLTQALSERYTDGICSLLNIDRTSLLYQYPDKLLSDNKEFINVEDIDKIFRAKKTVSTENLQDYRQYITAIKAKPFVLLAGISGTGKSRIVRQLAYATGGEDSRKVQKPFNYEMIPVRPNWHDSADLLGYVSRVSGKPEYIVTDFLRFLAKAWFYEKVPFFLCLDEMNLAPVEQYFAEFLSVTESRKLRDKQIVSDALIPPLSSFDKNVVDAEKVSDQILKDLFHGFWVKDGWENNDVANRIEQLKKQFRNEGISIPNNFIVMGTVNMDETTYSFSRKVLDRAMTIEMNIVKLEAGLDLSKDVLPSVSPEMILPMAVEGYDVYLGNEAICDQVIAYLKVVNRQLEGTPFKIGYRTRNEFLLYVLANLQFQSDNSNEKEVINRALDEITFMKILSRIEGDKNKVGNVLTDLETVIKESFPSLAENRQSVSLVKLGEMKGKLEKSFYCTFWS